MSFQGVQCSLKHRSAALEALKPGAVELVFAETAWLWAGRVTPEKSIHSSFGFWGDSQCITPSSCKYSHRSQSGLVSVGLS